MGMTKRTKILAGVGFLAGLVQVLSKMGGLAMLPADFLAVFGSPWFGLMGIGLPLLLISQERGWFRRTPSSVKLVRVPAPPTTPAPKRGAPPVGWMRRSEARRLAEYYAWPIREMTTRKSASLLVAEFIDNHPQHYDKERRWMERVAFERWIGNHRLPMPCRELAHIKREDG